MLEIPIDCDTVVELDLSPAGITDVRTSSNIEFLAQVRDGAGALVLTPTIEQDAQGADGVVEFRFTKALTAGKVPTEGLAFGVRVIHPTIGEFSPLEDSARLVQPTARVEEGP